MKAAFFAGIVAVAAALPLAANAQGIGPGAEYGARVGAGTAGPVGGIVGGAVGAGLGGAAGVFGLDYRPYPAPVAGRYYARKRYVRHRRVVRRYR